MIFQVLKTFPTELIEIPRILWDPVFHYRIHKNQTPVPIVSQLDLVHSPPHAPSHFSKIQMMKNAVCNFTIKITVFVSYRTQSTLVS
jgi:hypothetical protein